MLAECPEKLNFTHFLTLFGEKLHGELSIVVYNLAITRLTYRHKLESSGDMDIILTFVGLDAIYKLPTSWLFIAPASSSLHNSAYSVCRFSFVVNYCVLIDWLIDRFFIVVYISIWQHFLPDNLSSVWPVVLLPCWLMWLMLLGCCCWCVLRCRLGTDSESTLRDAFVMFDEEKTGKLGEE